MNFDRMLAPLQPLFLSILRIVMGLLFLHYGIAKFFKFPVVSFFAKLTTQQTIAGTLEFAGGILLILGLFTRPVAFILSGLMAFAYFLGHGLKNGLSETTFLPIANGGVGALIFCFVCLYLSAAGGGPLSLDAIVRRRA